MKTFIPGEIISTVKLKNNQEVVLRYPKWEDLEEMTSYINELSKEDTFIVFSGEINSLEEEARYVASVLHDMEFGNKVKVCAFAEDSLVGICDVSRITSGKTRELHIGLLGLTVKKDFRSLGLGEHLMRTAIEEAKKRISGLRLIILRVYEPNAPARALYEKIGFAEYGRLPGGLKYKEKFYDMIEMYFSLTK